MTTPSRRDLANAIRFLAIDAVEAAKSGHPGMPMGMADIAEVLWNDYLRHNPNNPNWFNRDRFVLTVGATANQNGTALFEGVTVLFLAQFFGVDLSLTQQATVMFVCILGGIGTAGVPAGSLPVVALICTMVGVPAEGIGLILGVDRFLDMCRTTLNVSGDLAAAVVISRGERSRSA